MKLTGTLKKQTGTANTKGKARDTMMQAGMPLDDSELEKVSGGRTIAFGVANQSASYSFTLDYCKCDNPCAEIQHAVALGGEEIKVCKNCGKFMGYVNP